MGDGGRGPGPGLLGGLPGRRAVALPEADAPGGPLRDGTCGTRGMRDTCDTRGTRGTRVTRVTGMSATEVQGEREGWDMGARIVFPGWSAKTVRSVLGLMVL